MTDKPMGCVNCGADDRDTKGCTRLPVVAWQVEFPLGNGAKVYEQRPSWAYESYGDLAYVTHELCRLTDAQARLAEKDARIAQLAAHARGKNKALANALKEIEILREANLRLDEEWQAMRHDLSVAQEHLEQLAQLQAAPAERGVVRQETNFVASTGEGRNPPYEGQFDDETPEQAARRLHWSRTAMEVQSARAAQPQQAVAVTDAMVLAARGVCVSFRGHYGEHNDYLDDCTARQIIEAALSAHKTGEEE